MRPKASPYHHGDLKRALLEAAVRHVSEKGAESLTLRDLARTVGVSHGAPYRHFADKSALLQAVAEGGFIELLRAMREEGAAEAETDPVVRFETAFRAYVRFSLENPAQLTLMFGPEAAAEACGPRVSEAAKATFEYVLGMIEQGQRQGAFKAGDPLLQAAAAWSLVHGISVLLSHGHLRADGLELRSREELVREVSRALLVGLRSQ